MSRGTMRHGRPLVVWLAITAAAALAGRSVPAAWGDAGAGAPTGDAVADALVAGCATVLAVALGWLWLVTTLTVTQVLAGSTPAGTGATRRLVLIACGAAVVAGTAAPAHADDGPTDTRGAVERLVGLPLPERAVAPATPTGPTTPTAPTAPTAEQRATAVAGTREAGGDVRYVVRPGDSLWSIARAHPAADDDVDQRWRAIWAANRDVVGADPDLIHPGQALRLPAAHPPTHTDEDGAR